jgi:Cu2+-exporting ATPase
MESSTDHFTTSLRRNTVSTLSNCFHCGLPNEAGEEFTVKINGEHRAMCCPGCHAVATAIVENGLEDYYTFRTELAAKGDELLDATLEKLRIYDQPAIQEEFVYEQGKHKQIQLTVEGITCAACGWLIEKQMSKVNGISQIAVNVANRRAIITWDPEHISLSEILSAFQKVGYTASPFQQDKHEESFKQEQKQYLKKVGLAGIMTMQVMMLMTGLYFDWFGNIEQETRQYFYWISLVLSTPVVFYSGSVFYISALKAIMARTVNMDVPVTLAIWGTYLAGLKATWLETGEVYFESICMFVFLLLLSRFLEHRSRHQASIISANMLQYIPVTATLITDDKLSDVLAKQLKPGQVVLVKTGETIPIDGKIVKGTTQVNESMLNGEFEPNTKTIGDRVYGGTINQADAIEVVVEKTLKDALVNQISRLQEQAMANKPRIALIADDLSRYFVVAVLVLSALTFTYWTTQGNPNAFFIMISVLVATCPCALGLATPSALTCGMARLNKLGILLKRADALEQVAKIDTLVLDKTGTLTQGKFSIEKSWFAENQNSTDALQLAQALESRSEHPIAEAFKLDDSFSSRHEISGFKTTIGHGIEGAIDNHHYHLGSERFIQTLGFTLPAEHKDALNNANVFMYKDSALIAAFWMSDTLKEGISETLAELAINNKVLLSGDTEKNVNQVATKLKLGSYLATQSPQDKLNYVNEAQSKGQHLMMLGDGINDAPVLSTADVSVAVGNATDIAKSSADVILLSDKLSALPSLFEMSNRTRRKIKQNIMWSLGYNLLVLPFAMSGLLDPWMAVVGMSLSSIIVVSNSTRLLKDKQQMALAS